MNRRSVARRKKIAVMSAAALIVSVVQVVALLGITPVSAADLEPPTALTQSDLQGVIAEAGVTNYTAVTLGANLSAGVGVLVKLEVELIPSSTGFADTATDSSALGDQGAATVAVPGLTPGETYHWQARTVDQNTLTSDWTAGGSFSVNTPPDAPSFLDQLRLDDTQILVGGNTDHTSVVLKGTVTDPDGDQVMLEVEVQDTGTALSETPTLVTELLDSGSTGSITVPDLTPDTNYHWQARATDEHGLSSGWVPFGDNSDTPTADTDFRDPQADLSVSQTLPTSVLASASNTPTTTRALTFSVTVSNLGPDTATHVALTNTFDATRVDPTSAMYCVESPDPCTPSTSYTGPIDLDPIPSEGSQVVDFTVNMLGSPNPLSGGPLDHTGLPSNARQALVNAVSVTSAVVDPVSDNNSPSGPVTVITAPDPVDNTKYDVQPGNGNAVVSWCPAATSCQPSPPPPTVDGGATVDFYRIKVTASPSGTGQGTFDVYPPTPTPPLGALVATACAGRLGGTLCYNLTGLTNDTAPPTPPTTPTVVYSVEIRAHNAVGLSDGLTRTASPSPSNSAVIVPPTTAKSFTTCSTATTKTPICITYSVPSGGGGAFSLQAITETDTQCANLGGSPTACGPLGDLASFEGHPPAGYTPTNPLMIQITWDVSIVVGTALPEVWYQPQGKDPKLLPLCSPKKSVAKPDPCVKAIKFLGKTTDTSKQCKPQSACFGDVQAQILLSSNPPDSGLYKRA